MPEGIGLQAREEPDDGGLCQAGERFIFCFKPSGKQLEFETREPHDLFYALKR